uniref:Protein broad-minded n=1 Tax=Phallusia mammillata TaxID=59560 RepID=A0A6F9DUI6_9ASCI|nr:protein broad-minded-like [Phallusia mammillata]
MEYSDKELLFGLHDLVSNVNSILKRTDLGSENAEDIILHLEETDDNFHRNNFVKFLCDSIGIEIGQLIDDEIERKSTTSNPNCVSNQHSLVHAVTETICKSSVYLDLSKQLCANSVLTATELCKKSVSASSDDDTESYFSRQLKSMCSEGELSYGSSFNQGIFFMTQEQFHRIAEELSSAQPLNKRREALLRLCQVPPSDVMASESWSHLRIALMDALADSDNFISHTALSFHAKMFAVSSYQIMRETFTCLSEHIMQCFKIWPIQTTDEDLFLSEPYISRTLLRLRLLNEFQCEVPSIWVRYPESFLDSILNSTFNLMTEFIKAAPFSGLHLISLVDIDAHWFRKWLHGNYGRAAVISRLEKKYRQFLVYVVHNTMQFCQSYVHNQAITVDIKVSQQDRIVYSLQHLDFACFIHCLSIIARLVMYSCGRELFPVHLPDGQVIHVQDMLVSWIMVLNLADTKSKPINKYEPASFIAKALCNLCSSNAFVKECVGKQFISSLIGSIQNWLSIDTKQIVSESTMLHIAEILACLTSTCSGRKLLLFKYPTAKGSAAHNIAQFAQKALEGKLQQSLQQRFIPSHSVIGAYVFVCRQLYNTCEGLLLLMEYQLHEKIAAAWKQTHEIKQFSSLEEVDSDQQSIPTQSSSRSTVMWEDTLLDNLLNFAATPQGLLLLQQTGAINECVAYMHSRYTKKLQVSKCEKFGYGVMVTQLASTAAGTMALQHAGFLRAIVHEFWASIECTELDTQQPSRSNFLGRTERPVHKAFTGLANVLSSFQSVHEIFVGKKLANKSHYSFREIPNSPLDLLDRLVMLNSPQKYHFLLNYEQSHVFGLRLLTLLSCNLDTLLLLETQYKIQQLLLDLQKSNQTSDSCIIIDELTIERNHFLVRTHLIGGEGEKVLPPRTLSSVKDSKNKNVFKTGKSEPYVWPLFSQYPIPKAYVPELSDQTFSKKDSMLARFLSKSRVSDKNFLSQLRSIFAKAMTSSPSTVRGNVVEETLERVVTAFEKNSEERRFKRSPGQVQGRKEAGTTPLPVIVAGTKMTVQYGKLLSILKSSSDTAYNNLINVLQSCIQFLNQQHSYSTSLRILAGPYPCHDWFVSTIFLMFSGNKDKSLQFLLKLSELFVSGYLWPARLHASIHLPPKVRLSGIPPLYYRSGHHIELIVQMELPLIYSAFRMSGYTPSQIAQHWLTQCFWNYLPWLQITHYVTTVLVMGCDYQVYICVSILKHLQQSILMHRQTQDLQVFLKENYIKGFSVGNWMEYMETLETKYRATVLQSMRNLAD